MIKRKLLHKKRRKKINQNNPKFIKPKKIREPFRVNNGETILWLKNEVLKMQTELAVVLRERNLERVTQLIRKMLRSDLTHQLAVYRTISSSGSKSKGINDSSRPITQIQYN